MTKRAWAFVAWAWCVSAGAAGLACSGSDVEVGNATDGGGTDGTTSGNDGGGSGSDGGGTSDGGAKGDGNADNVCGSEGTASACSSCCGQLHPGASALIADAAYTCACSDNQHCLGGGAQKCGTQQAACLSELRSIADAGAGCQQCFQSMLKSDSGVNCVQEINTACAADPGCSAALTCARTQCAGKP